MAASATRSLLRATHSIPRPTFVRPTVTPRFATPSTSTASALRSSSSRQSSRGYSTGPQPSSSSSNNTLLYSLIGATLVAGGGYYAYTQSSDETRAGAGSKSGAVKNAAQKVDYQKVYNAVAEILEKDAENYDDGSYAPVLFRLAWHCSGTYDKETGSGGSNGATMRFAPESDHGANAGLHHAREKLEPVKKQFPEITYSDLWTLAGVVAVQEMGGPKVAWRPGRQDGLAENCTPDGRLPDGDKDQDHLRKIFYRMGFNDQEIVALSGAHAVGRCHADRSGFDGPWSHSPITFSNEYYRLLFEEKWQPKKWKGPIQYEDKSTKSLMMLTTDMALTKDKSFKKYAEKYAKDESAFFEDFSKVFSKLIELGVPADNFKQEAFYLKPVHEQGA